MLIVIATLLSGLVGASTTATVSVVKNKRSVKQDEETRQAETDAYINGVPAVPGVTDGAVPAALRTERLERTVAGVVQGQALLEKRMDEANGTGKRTEQMVRAIQEHLGLATP